MTTLRVHFPEFQLQPQRLIFVNAPSEVSECVESAGNLDSIYTGIVRDEFDSYLASHHDIRAFFERDDKALLSIPSKDVVFRSVCSKVARKIKEMLSKGEIVTANYVRAFAELITDSKCRIAKLKVDSQLDILTDLPDRRAFEARLKIEIARSHRDGAPLSMLILDLDKFKDVNDRCGHLAGDEVLKFVGASLKNTGVDKVLRVTDFVSRVGGDEIYILLPNTDIEGACIVARRIQEAIGSREFAFGSDSSPHSFRVQTSIGISHFEGINRDSDGKTMIGCADHCLYVMKGKRSDVDGVQEERRGNIAVEGRIVPPEEIADMIRRKKGSEAQIIQFPLADDSEGAVG